MIILKSITIKNFLSVGNVTQAVNLHKVGLTLVLGENLDLGGGGSRNGCGKSLITQAISFALYGLPLTNIKLDNLINKTNNKEMVVSIDFQKNSNKYRIERGRRPGIIKFYINDSYYPGLGEDEAHGESRITQREINKVLGMTRDIFKHIVALNTFTEPFLSQGAHVQRILIEELLGITRLSQKAELLKEKNRQTKENIVSEEIKIKSVLNANDKIQSNIDQLKLKSVAWGRIHKDNIKKHNDAKKELEKVNIELEINQHSILSTYKELTSKLKQANINKQSEETTLLRLKKQLDSLIQQIESVKEHTCPMCGNEIHDTKHEEILSSLKEQEKDTTEQTKTAKTDIRKIDKKIIDIEKDIDEIGDKPATYYSTLEEAYNHRTTLDNLLHTITTEENSENPYVDQIVQFEQEGIQDVSYDELNHLTRWREHQEFLHKLLVDKTSFIRKKIIDQNLSYLNHRLNFYLEKLGLPHEVRFLNELSVEISELGRDYDFDNLSRGEKNRLILGLSFAFRDVWENLNDPINLLFIDELIDSGLDQVGVENALAVIKTMGRDRKKDVFLISHKDELISRVSNVMLVKKENGFTSFTEDAEALEEV